MWKLGLFLLANECKRGDVDLADFMQVFKLIITVVQWAVPVALILWGSIDLFKAITSSKDDEIKKKQTLLFKKVLAAVIVFILPWLIFTIMGMLGSSIAKLADCYKSVSAGIPSFDSGYNNESNGKSPNESN